MATLGGLVHVPCEYCDGRIACPVTGRVADPLGLTVRVDSGPLENHYRKNHYDQVVTRLRQERAASRELDEADLTPRSLLGVSWT